MADTATPATREWAVRPGQLSDESDTPALLVDLDRLERNIARFQALADAHAVKLRPHIKTHGEDLSIGYDSHEGETVRVYLEESFSLHVATPEAAVALKP